MNPPLLLGCLSGRGFLSDVEVSTIVVLIHTHEIFTTVDGCEILHHQKDG